jgi:hypothetical protein
MNYVIKLARGESAVVDQATGERLKGRLIDGDLDGFFSTGRSMYPVKEVKGVIAQEDSRVPDYSTQNFKKVIEFERNLGRFSQESVIEKVKREIRYRIKPGLRGEPCGGWQELANTIGQFFRENPKYPWCPLTEWIHLVFPKGSTDIPHFFQAVVRHDIRVHEWLEGGTPRTEEAAIDVFDGTLLGGGDLDD